MVYNHYLVVQPWSREFSMDESHPSNIIAWIRLLGLHYHYYTKGLMRTLAEVIVKVIKIDYNTTDGKRGRFARIAVVVYLTNLLCLSWGSTGKKQAVVYEGLLLICYDCPIWSY